MNSLFENDPAYQQAKRRSTRHRLRDSNGRFATEREARASKALKENERLKRDVEKYRRAYLSSADMSAHWHRKYMDLRVKLQAIAPELLD